VKCIERVKRKKIDLIVNSHSVSELAFAALSQFHKDEKRSAAILIKEVVENPDKAYEIKQNLQNDNNNEPILYHGRGSFSFFVENDLSKKYINISH